MRAVGVSLTHHTEWMRPLLINQGVDILMTPANPGWYFRVLIDVIQEGLPTNAAIMDLRLAQHDHVVLFNPETPPDIHQLAPVIDRPGVTLVTTGHVAHDFQHAHVIEYENFFHEQQRLYQLPDCLQDLQALTHGKHARHRFDALLGQTKSHREFIYQQIMAHDPQQFVCRYYRHTHNIARGIDFEWPQNCRGLSQVGKQASYHGTTIDVAHVIPVSIYNDSRYSIVAETRTSGHYVFTTEKTAKCLLARRLFVMFAGVGYLAHLHRRGFRTFDTVIDESYDQEPDDLRRWQQAWQQVQRLLDLDPQWVLEQVQSALDHNHRLLTTADWSYEHALAQHLKQLAALSG